VTCCCFLVSLGSIILHIFFLEKDQNSKFEAQFLLNSYGFYTIIKLKNHVKLGCNPSTQEAEVEEL
jgi:hypothetical protein